MGQDLAFGVVLLLEQLCTLLVVLLQVVQVVLRRRRRLHRIDYVRLLALVQVEAYRRFHVTPLTWKHFVLEALHLVRPRRVRVVELELLLLILLLVEALPARPDILAVVIHYLVQS